MHQYAKIDLTQLTPYHCNCICSYIFGHLFSCFGQETTKRPFALRLELLSAHVVALPGGRRGGSSYSHWPEEYAKYPIFSTFEADFCTKNENSLPNGIGDESWSRTWCEIEKKNWVSAWRKTFFSFFGDHLNLDRETDSIWVKPINIWVKIVWCCFQPPKQPPPMQIPGYAPVPTCLPVTTHGGGFTLSLLINCWSSSREAVNINFYILWFDLTPNRNRRPFPFYLVAKYCNHNNCKQ